MRAAVLVLLLGLACAARAQEVPSWFSPSLLYLPEDVAEAARQGKRVMLYFGQPGCPYCKRLIEVNWTRPSIVDKMRRRFVSLEINIWGDRGVTWVDGTETTEKRLAALLKVQFTPTLLFLDEKGGIALRINGYYPPEEFEAAIDSVFSQQQRAEKAAPRFTRKPGGKPFALLFESAPCAACEELRLTLARAEVRAQLAKFDLARHPLSGDRARALGVARAPTMVLFDASGREVLRLEAYFRPFHVAGSLEYVSSGAYRVEPSFQRFLQAKAERLRSRGEVVDLWK